MPAYRSATICGRNCRHKVGWVALLAALVIWAGCDGDDVVDEQMAARHAEANAELIADRTIFFAREWVLIHPQSERQRHAREQLLFLQQLEDSMPDKEADEQRLRMERQLEHIYRWRDSSPPLRETP